MDKGPAYSHHIGSLQNAVYELNQHFSNWVLDMALLTTIANNLPNLFPIPETGSYHRFCAQGKNTSTRRYNDDASEIATWLIMPENAKQEAEIEWYINYHQGICILYTVETRMSTNGMQETLWGACMLEYNERLMDWARNSLTIQDEVMTQPIKQRIPGSLGHGHLRQ